VVNKMIIASNFKTNHTRKSTREYLIKLNNFISEKSISNIDIMVFPPSVAFDNFKDFNKHIDIGAQNAYHTIRGSFTGDIGKEHLDEFNINSILIGHSERRTIFNETQDLIDLKFKFYSSYGFKIIYCIGEPLEIKEQGIEKTIDYLENQLKSIDLDYKNLIIAYEPIWAIGTGKTATLNDIDEVHTRLKNIIDKPILYGGSVKACNSKDITDIKNVDGLLIGTASWNIDDFCRIIDIVNL